MEVKLDERYIVAKIVEFLGNKKDGNWHLEKAKLRIYMNMVQTL